MYFEICNFCRDGDFWIWWKVVVSGHLRILKVGRTVHITILMQFLKEMFVFR